MVAIVGTRGAYREGIELARQLAADLAHAGLTIVSGGAIGIDAAAHRGALAAGGSTLAVLGSGMDQLFPARNRALFCDIAARGALVTAYPPETPPRRWQFPARNRIVAALSGAVVVVEAPSRSGALNTASHARRLGLPVLAAPRGAGAQGLLRRGAGLVERAADVLRALEGASPRLLPPLPEEPDAARVLAAVRGAGPAGLALDDLARALGWRLPRAAGALLRLEVGGWVRSLPGGRFVTSPG